MKFVNPSVEILNIPSQNDHDGVLKFIEKIGRICYKSEEKITDDSCYRFIKMLKERHHWAMLEHFRFIMAASEEAMASFNDRYMLDYDAIDEMELEEKMRFVSITYDKDAPADRKYIISGSATAWNNIWNTDIVSNNPDFSLSRICHFLHSKYPELMLNPTDFEDKDIDINGIRFLSDNEIENLPAEFKLYHTNMTVLFNCDRGVTHEIVRHRPASYAMSSTRYINYTGEGGHEAEFVIPCWFDENDRQALLNNDIDSLSEEAEFWFAAQFYSSMAYKRLINENGWKPQQARSVLSHSIKAELVMTATLSEWVWWFKMRADSAAHPQMQELAYPLLHEAYLQHQLIFDQLEAKSRKEGK